MGKRTYRQDPETLELIEITESQVREPNRLKGDASLWNDRSYTDLRAPDGTDISSRSKQRAYLKQNGLADYSDFAGEFARKRKERDAFHSGNTGSIKRDDINQAIEYLKNRQ